MYHLEDTMSMVELRNQSKNHAVRLLTIFGIKRLEVLLMHWLYTPINKSDRLNFTALGFDVFSRVLEWNDDINNNINDINNN